MNRFCRFVTLWIALFAIHGTLSADEIVDEPFDYEPGELHAQDGGEGWGSAWTAVAGLTTVVDTTDDPLEFDVSGGGTVRDGGRALALIGNSDEIVYRDLEDVYNDDEVYIRFLFRFEGVVHNNDFLSVWLDQFLGGQHTAAPNIGLKGNQNGLGPLDLFARIQINNETYSEDIQPDATYLIVGRLWKSIPGEFEPYDRYDLWVNPAHEDEGAPNGTSIGTALSEFSIVGIRVPTFGVEDRALIGSFRMGTDWDSVVPEGDEPEPPPSPLFRRGDVDGSGAVNLSDGIFTLNYLFLAGPVPTCLDAADSDDSASVNLSDAVFLLNYLFLSGPTPLAPFPDCGATDREGLGCETSPCL
ncbi:MAG: hypothetical protein AAF517_13730 [Planctomycetota bacterium]